MAPLNILIIGCSIAGPTLASFLLSFPGEASSRPHITVLERSSTVRAEGQNIDVRGAGVAVIRKLGLEGAIRASTTGEEGVQLVDDKNGIWAQFAADKTGKTQTPTSDIEILRGRLAQLCYGRSASISDEVKSQGGAGVEYVFGDYLESLEQDGDKVHVQFAKSKQRRTFDLVVGADGLQSRTRSMVWGSAGESDRIKRLGMFGGFFSMPRGETDTMWRRWFHAPRRRGIMLRPSDAANTRTTVIMTVMNDADERLISVASKGSRNVHEQKQLLKEYFQDLGWECPRVVEGMMKTDDFYYDMVAQVKMDSWSKGRVVLLGDAGYCASPISGMGTTLAMYGAYSLAGALLQHPGDIPAAFAQYDEKLRPLVDKAQKLAPGFPRLINPETAWGVWLLNAIVAFFFWTKLATLLIKFKGPPANFVQVEEYGLKQQAEWRE